MNKVMPLLILIILLAGAGFVAWQKFSVNNTWVCTDGAWVKNGNPLTPQPAAPCVKETPETPKPKPQNTDDLIKVDAPAKDAVVSGPLAINGQARGTWYFEASFPVKLLDKDGKELAAGIAVAQSDWMTEEFVPFTAELEYTVTATTSAVLVLQKDNPSGLPENDAEVRVPLTLLKSEDMGILVYFGNNKNDPQMLDCGKTAPVERFIPRTTAVGKAAIEELLKGPTETETKQGFFTSLNTGIKLEKLTITDGVATAEFDDRLEYQVGGSCRVAAIRAQIESTLKQFPTVKSVVIMVNGRTEDVLQP